jgi:hypothetical protein
MFKRKNPGIKLNFKLLIRSLSGATSEHSKLNILNLKLVVESHSLTECSKI